MSSEARRMRRLALKQQGRVAPAPLVQVAAEQVKQAWPRYRVAIASPMMDMCHTLYTVSLVRMVAWTLGQCPGIGFHFLQYGTSMLPLSRQLLAAQANDLDATHVLWIDSDMTFPENAIPRMLEHGKPIVAANCLSRRPPFAYTARTAGEQIQTNDDSTGLQQVVRCQKVRFDEAIDVHRMCKATPAADQRWNAPLR